MKNLIVLFYAIIVSSCINEKTVDKELNYDLYSNEELIENVIEFEIIFPDTVFVNMATDGLVKYKSILDTITTTFGQKEKNRYTRFILMTTDKIDYEYEHLKKNAKDTFGAINNRTIPFYDIKFTQTGVYYIDGIINDIVLIDLFTKDEEGNELVRLIEYDKRITHKVVVVNNAKQD